MLKAELYWIPGPWPGRLAIAPRPRSGDWLEDEIRSWHQQGIDIMVSALTNEEIEELGLGQEANHCGEIGIEYIAFPISDCGVPSSSEATIELVRRLEGELAEGKKVGIHCRIGVGRSALLAASVLVASGFAPAKAFERIQAVRGCRVPDTAEQEKWVVRHAPNLVMAKT